MVRLKFHSKSKQSIKLLETTGKFIHQTQIPAVLSQSMPSERICDEVSLVNVIALIAL